MHRKGKGLLSLILTFAMVTAAAAPVSADELSEHQPAEEQLIVEAIEETELVQEPNMAEQETVQVPETVPEPIAAEQETVIPTVAAPETVTEPNAEAADPLLTEAESVSGQEQSIAETMETETEITPIEQNTPGAELVSASGTDLDYLYNNLTEEQKQFRVYAGTDISSDLTFMDSGVTPDSENLDLLGASIGGKLLANRQGDLQFYSLSGWKLWKVDSSGAPEGEEPLTTSISYKLSGVATKNNFQQAAYMVNNGTGTSPAVICQKPILEPVWSCYPIKISIYDKDGNDTGEKLAITAENYNNAEFPVIESDGWKLIYNNTECRLNTASEIWTNETNGIRVIGKAFDESKAKLQAYTLPVTDGTKYEISGPQEKEGWYTGAVTVRAKDGYQVRLSEAEAWTDAVTIAQSGNVTLYVKEADGTELPVEMLQFLIDETDPVIVGVLTGQTYYGDTAVAVTDDHLLKVTVNDEAQTIENNQAGFVLAPSELPYIIKAEDMAGNWIENIVFVKNAEEAPVLQEGTAEFVQPGWHVGETMPAPIVSSETNGVDHITYSYKDQGADDYAYTAVPPTQTGKYTARAVFAATPLYREVIRTSNFEILPKVDTDMTFPVISGVSDGQTCFGDQTVTVTDENLQTVTVNGTVVEVTDNRAEFILKPSEEVYQIVAEDKAGNRTQYTVEVWETWVRDGISTNGKKKLRTARLYKLGSGQWTVDGDSTIYQGGGTFYVKNGGEYDFKKN